MSKYSIGLDLGINNVGWAIYDFDKKLVIDKGVARFEASDTAENRRNIRNSRRLNKRKHHRVERIALLLNKINFCTKRSYEPELLFKRIKGLNDKLSQQEITNIIYYFAIHRGYIPFNDEKTDREVKKFSNDEFPCYYIKQFYDEYGKYRGNCDLILMKDNLRELKAILKKQGEFYIQLTNGVIEQILEIVSSKREFWEGPGSPKENQLSPYGRYRNLEDLQEYEKDSTYHQYLYEMLIGKCELSIDKLGNIENVAPKYNYFAEEFNFYNDFINMSVVSPTLLDEEYFYKVNFKTGHFTEETIEEFKSYILENKTIDFEKMMKKILNTDITNIQGYRQNKDKKPEISKFDFYKKLKKRFEENDLKPSWLYSEDRRIYNKVIYVLTVAPSAYAIQQMLSDRIKDIDFTNQEVEILQDIKKKNNKELTYHSLSESILKKALLDMKRSGFQYNFMQIMKKQEYDREMKEYFQNNYSKNETIPYMVEDKYVDTIITNPQVKKTLRKAIKVINKIIETQQDYPYAIEIESAKEMNSKREKTRIEAEQKRYENFNNKARKILQEEGYSVTPKHIDLVINWEETNHKCAYCGKPLNVHEVIKNDIEHILPQSKTMDNSSENTTCSCPKCNTEKNDRTPWEYLTSKNEYEKFKQRVLHEFDVSEKKKDNLLFEGNIEKYSLKFINRNLRDVAYGTTALVNELNKYNEYLYAKVGYKINIVSTPGQLTHKIRRKLELSNKNRDYLYHHAVDAMILASIVDTPIGEVLIESQNDSKYWINHNNDIYIEKVLDMIESIDLKNLSQIKEFNKKCDNQPDNDKDALIKRSFEVKRNPIRKFSDANYVKYIKKEENQYYKISQIDNIYNLIIRDKSGRDGKDKKIMDKLFDSSDSSVHLLCEEKDQKLFTKLKNIYEHYTEAINPFVAECIYREGLEENNAKFNYLIHGIRKTNNLNSPIVVRLRYLETANLPYLKELKSMKKNMLGEFIETKAKENTLIGLNGLGQVCTRLFYSLNEQKFIFMPIYAICYKNKKIDETNKYYKELYNYFVGNNDVKKLFDINCGNWLGVYKKDGTYFEARYSTYNKALNMLECKNNGNLKVYITASCKQIILFKVDILGNKYVKFDTNNFL